MISAGCSKKGQQSSEVELAKTKQISEEAEVQSNEIANKIRISEKEDTVSRENEDIRNNGDSNRKAPTGSYRLSIPSSYTRVDHNDHIYVYDSNGNSLSVSSQLTEMKVDEYSEKNYHKLISAGYKDIEFQKFDHITINNMKSMCIEYLGSKNDKEFMNCRYYVENGENTILIDVQAVDESNYSKLKSMAETMKF